jgi:excisionase family DNA binding protein
VESATRAEQKISDEPAGPLLLTGDVARILAVSAETVRFWHRIGRLPALKTARGVRLFNRGDVDRLARERLP